jgi:hypothetical protein
MCNSLEDSVVQGCYAVLSGEQILFEVSCTAHAAYITLFLLSCTCSQISSDANSSFLLSRRCRTLKAVLQSCCGVMLLHSFNDLRDVWWLWCCGYNIIVFMLTSVMCCWSASLYLPVFYIINIIDISH